MSEDVFGDRLQLGLQPPFWVILFLIAGGAAIEAKLFGPPSGRALHERGACSMVGRHGFFASWLFCLVVDVILMFKILFLSGLSFSQSISGFFLVLSISPNVAKANTMMALSSLYHQANAWRKYAHMEEVPGLPEELEKRGRKFIILHHVSKFGLATPVSVGFVWCVPAFLAFFYVFLFLQLCILLVSQCVKPAGAMWMLSMLDEASRALDDHEHERATRGHAAAAAGAAAAAAASAGAPGATAVGSAAAGSGQQDGDCEQGHANAAQAPPADATAGASSGSNPAQASAPAGAAAASQQPSNPASSAEQTPLLQGGYAGCNGSSGSGMPRPAEAQSEQDCEANPQPSAATDAASTPDFSTEGTSTMTNEPNAEIEVAFAIQTGAPMGLWTVFFFASLETLAFVMFAPMAARLYDGQGYWSALKVTLIDERSLIGWLRCLFQVGSTSREAAFWWIVVIRWLF